MRIMLGVIAAVVFAASTAAYSAEQASERKDVGKRLPIIETYATEYPAFDKKWTQAVQQEDPNAFIDLLTQESPRIQDKDRLVARSLLDIYLQSGMSPWIAFAGHGYSGTPVVPTGKLHLTIRAEFNTFMNDRQRTATILDVASKPPLPRLMGEFSTGWMPGRTKEGGPTIDGWVDQSVWLRLPNEAEPGPVDLTVFARTEGSQDGVIMEKTQKEQHRIQIVAPPEPTRENVLCLWCFGLESGKWLSKSEDKSEQEKRLRRNQLVWVDFLLKEFASNEQLGHLVAALREREEYVMNVLNYLEAEGE